MPEEAQHKTKSHSAVEKLQTVHVLLSKIKQLIIKHNFFQRQRG